MTLLGDAELHERWSAWLLHRNRQGTTTALWISLTLYPLFGVLDYLVAPSSWLWLLFGTRGAVTAVTVVMLMVVRRPFFSRYPDVISAAYMVLISSGISMMTLFMGGLASPYYAGLTLTIVASGLLYVWPRKIVIITHTVIFASFVIPNLAVSRGPLSLTAISNLLFLVSTAIIVGAGQMLAYGSQRQQVVKQLIIERTKKNLEYAHNQLKRLDRFKSEFFANITHELKTPLTMMLAPLELMVDGQLGGLTPAQRSTLSSIQRSGVKLLRLIADLLDLSKLEESRLRLRVDEHDVVSYLRALAVQIEPLAQRKSIEISFATNVEECVVWCDLERIERIFVNLLSNATKFTPPSGQVAITVEDEGHYVRIDVADTGIGFPPDMAETIFERFFQVDMAGTRKFGGTGIGLALAKELVLLHGGSIWAVSEIGEGAIFSVRFTKGKNHFGPDVLERRGAHTDRASGQRTTDRAVAEWQVGNQDRFRLIEIDEATDQRVVERDPDEARRPHSVLVVDDTVDVLRVVRLALHQEVRVFAASDGQKGLELAQKHRPNVIITDLMMPVVDGLELTQRIRADARTKHIPILMLTARDDIEDRVAGLDTGVSAYLAKPFSTKELVSTVRALLATQAVTADVLLSQRIELAGDHRRGIGPRDPQSPQLREERRGQYPARHCFADGRDVERPQRGQHRRGRHAGRRAGRRENAKDVRDRTGGPHPHREHRRSHGAVQPRRLLAPPPALRSLRGRTRCAGHGGTHHRSQNCGDDPFRRGRVGRVRPGRAEPGPHESHSKRDGSGGLRRDGDSRPTWDRRRGGAHPVDR